MREIAIVRQGVVYEQKYVDLLRGMCPDCVVLTDQFYPRKRVRLTEGWPGWWSKMELFGPRFEKHRPCLFLDLDTYVLGDISDLLEFESDDLWLLRDFNVPAKGQSAVMLIPKDTREIYEVFQRSAEPYMKLYRAGGDQEYLNLFPMKFLQDRFEGIRSYKRHKLQDAPEGRIVCFHGHPKPHETEGWAKDVWTSVKP